MADDPANEGLAAIFDDFAKTLTLTEAATGRPIEARFIPLTRAIARDRIDKLWWKDLPCLPDVRKREPDVSWKWVDLLGSLKNGKGGGYARGWAVEIEGDEEIQGAILYQTNTVSYFRDAGGCTRPAVYGAYLASAPRNRDRLMAPTLGRYRGVGTGLLRLSVAHSHYLNGEGRVVLRSVDHPSTVKLYNSFGFSSVDPSGEDRLVMELTKEAAARYLREMGLR